MNKSNNYGIPVDPCEPSEEEVEKVYQRLKKETEQSGYYLNPDIEFTRDLVRSLLINEKRYGYQACPCRLADGTRGEDLDIICPCYYRDPDLTDYEACYCALYVSEAIAKGEKPAEPIPERRPSKEERDEQKRHDSERNSRSLRENNQGATPGKRYVPAPSLPVWRCKVCGYLCGREHPPDICPICKAKKDRFELFM